MRLKYKEAGQERVFNSIPSQKAMRCLIVNHTRMKVIMHTINYLKRGITMSGKVISYNKLWKMLIDKKMTKSDLKWVSGISTTSIAKLGKGENITTNVLLKICKALNCGINDIIDMEEDEDF